MRGPSYDRVVLVSALIVIPALALVAIFAFHAMRSEERQFRNFCEDRLSGEVVPGPDGDVCVRGDEIVYDGSNE